MRTITITIFALAFVVYYWRDFSSDRDDDSSSDSNSIDSSSRLSISNAKKRGLELIQQPDQPQQDATTTNNNNNDNVCNYEDLMRLTTLIKSDPEEYSLRPLSIPRPEGGEMHFSGLNSDLVSRAFLNNRIAIMGDSTSKNLFQWMRILLGLMIKEHPTISTSLDRVTLTEGTHAVIKFSKFKMSVQGAFGPNMDKKKTYVIPWVGDDNALMFKRIELYYASALEKDIPKFKPRVILANIGLHLLHINNYRKTKSHIPQWVGYEKFLEETVAAAEASGAEILLFKTSNFVCAKQYTESWRVGNKLYSSGDKETLDACFTSYRDKKSNIETSDEDIRNYCENGVLNDKGAGLLNERVYRFVADFNSKGRDSSLKVGVFNDHDIQSCKSSKDGRHHHVYNLARIRLLGNYIDCLNNWDGLVEG